MTREEALRIFRKEIECLSHTKCEDCILKKACDPMITTPSDSEYIEAYSMAIKALEQEPIKGHCKDCKWWKDSDGEYRRGCEAESICRINTDKVYQGEGYCYLFEPQESEDNNA